MGEKDSFTAYDGSVPHDCPRCKELEGALRAALIRMTTLAGVCNRWRDEKECNCTECCVRKALPDTLAEGSD